jgi:hypothetical protein
MSRAVSAFALILLALVVCLVVGPVVKAAFLEWSFQQSEKRSHPEPSSVTNRTMMKSYSLLPSQSLDLTNSDWGDVEVRSEYPVSVLNGECHSDYTVQWHCSGAPHDLVIRDARRTPLFFTPRANSVTVTLHTY